MIAIQAYDPAQDPAAVLALWDAALGQQWPITPEEFQRVTSGASNYQPGDYLVARAEAGGAIVGFVTSEMPANAPEAASISVLLVHPQQQRQGIGRMLHQAALARLRQQGATKVQIGGGGSRFWPGVADRAAGGKAIFRSLRLELQPAESRSCAAHARFPRARSAGRWCSICAGNSRGCA